MRVKVEREWDDDVCIARSVHNRSAEFEEKEICLIKPDTGEMNDYYFFFFLSSLPHTRTPTQSDLPLNLISISCDENQSWQCFSVCCFARRLFRARERALGAKSNWNTSEGNLEQ